MEKDVLEKLFTSPLLTRAEVDKQNLEILTAACEKGLVGSKVFQEYKTKPTIYWLKGSLSNEVTPTAHRSKRKFISPVVGQRSNSPKRHKQLASSTTPTLNKETSDTEGDEKDVGGGESQSLGSVTQASKLLKEKQILLRQLEEKKEKLRKLNMVKMYRVKNNLEELQVLVGRWRTVSQEVAEELLIKSTRQPPPTMTDLLIHLHIDPTLIHYSTQDEGFY